jgi:PHP domain
MNVPKPPKPPKRRRLRAPIEEGIGSMDPHADDPRSALHKQRRRQETVGCTSDAEFAADEGDVDARYAELHCVSNFSFQRGASSARELFGRAKRLGYGALAVTDECSLAGIVRALEASKQTGVKLIVGTEIKLADGPKLVLLAQNQDGYSDICRLITAGRAGALARQRSRAASAGERGRGRGKPLQPRERRAVPKGPAFRSENDGWGQGLAVPRSTPRRNGGPALPNRIDGAAWREEKTRRNAVVRGEGIVCRVAETAFSGSPLACRRTASRCR